MQSVLTAIKYVFISYVYIKQKTDIYPYPFHLNDVNFKFIMNTESIKELDEY